MGKTAVGQSRAKTSLHPDLVRSLEDLGKELDPEFVAKAVERLNRLLGDN